MKSDDIYFEPRNKKEIKQEQRKEWRQKMLDLLTNRDPNEKPCHLFEEFKIR